MRSISCNVAGPVVHAANARSYSLPNDPQPLTARRVFLVAGRIRCYAAGIVFCIAFWLAFWVCAFAGVLFP